MGSPARPMPIWNPKWRRPAANVGGQALPHLTRRYRPGIHWRLHIKGRQGYRMLQASSSHPKKGFLSHLKGSTIDWTPHIVIGQATTYNQTWLVVHIPWILFCLFWGCLSGAQGIDPSSYLCMECVHTFDPTVNSMWFFEGPKMRFSWAPTNQHSTKQLGCIVASIHYWKATPTRVARLSYKGVIWNNFARHNFKNRIKGLL